MSATAAESEQYRHLWPLAGLLVCELAAFAVAARIGDGLPITSFSATVAFVCLVVGLLPALVRPTHETALAGCLATILAAFIAVPFVPDRIPSTPIAMTIFVAPPYVLLRLLNGFMLPPLLLHYVARYPPAARDGRCAVPADRTVVIGYAGAVGLNVAQLLVTTSTARIVCFVLLLGWSILLLARAAQRLLCISRMSEWGRAAQQARVLLLGVGVTLAPIAIRLLAYAGIHVPYDAVVLTQLALPAGVTYTIMRHDFGIDATLRRALAYTTLSVLLLVLYFAVSMVATFVLARTVPAHRGLAAACAVGAAALAFRPLGQRAQRWIDVMLYPDRFRFQTAVTEAGATLGRVAERNEILALLTETLPDAIGATWAHLNLPPAPEVPKRSGQMPAWNAQLRVGGRYLGRYWLGPRRAGPAYDADETAQLRALVQQAALALAYADTIAELRALNRELEARVAERTSRVLDQQRELAAYAERQRLARELHDSVTQTLFSITLGVGAIRKQLGDDRTDAADALAAQEEAARRALGEMRALLDQLRAEMPARSGEQIDIAAALDRHCTELERRSGTSVALRAPDTLRLRAEVAHEMLHIAREAIHNARKHSDAETIHCRLIHDEHAIELIVTDDGCGFETYTPTNGYGLQGMRERAASIGAALNVTSRPGTGTDVHVRLPAPAEQEIRP